MRALCSFEDLCGLHARRAPAVFSLLAAIELDDDVADPDVGRPDAGVFYPLGGWAVSPVACGRCDGEWCRDSDRDKRRGGSRRREPRDGRADGRRRESTPTPLWSTPTWRPRSQSSWGASRAPDYASSRYSTSSITFLWALDRRFEQLQHHNVFLSEGGSGRSAFLSAWNDQLPPRGASTAFPANGFHFYLCCNSGTDATAAPAGGDSLMVLCPTPPLDDADDALVDEWIAKARAAVYERLRKSAGADIEPHVIHEKGDVDQREWRDGLGLRRGSVFGLAHGLDQLALFRPSRQSSRVDGLSFVEARRRAPATAYLSCSRRRGSSVMRCAGGSGLDVVRSHYGERSSTKRHLATQSWRPVRH